MVDALAWYAEEGRIRPRKSSVRSQNPVTRRYPNGVTPVRVIGLDLQFIAWSVTRRTETSKYPEENKSKEIPLVSGERTGNSPNPKFI